MEKRNTVSAEGCFRFCIRNCFGISNPSGFDLPLQHIEVFALQYGKLSLRHIYF
jgi:hypothetical protein